MTSKPLAAIAAAVLLTAFAAQQGSRAEPGDQAPFHGALRVQGLLPPGHPPITEWRLPDDIPPILDDGRALPPGHPPLPRQRSPGCRPEGLQPFHGEGDATSPERDATIIST